MFFWKSYWKFSSMSSSSICVRCFNPCSSGKATGSLGISLVELQKESFNPCSSGKATGSAALVSCQQPQRLFQSLFFWKSYWKITVSCRQTQPGQVSILVLLEKLLEVPLRPGEGGPGRVSILVLLEKLLEDLGSLLDHNKELVVSILVLLEKLLEVAHGGVPMVFFYSFNPCSSGKATGRV